VAWQRHARRRGRRSVQCARRRLWCAGARAEGAEERGRRSRTVGGTHLPATLTMASHTSDGPEPDQSAHLAWGVKSSKSPLPADIGSHRRLSLQGRCGTANACTVTTPISVQRSTGFARARPDLVIAGRVPSSRGMEVAAAFQLTPDLQGENQQSCRCSWRPRPESPCRDGERRTKRCQDAVDAAWQRHASRRGRSSAPCVRRRQRGAGARGEGRRETRTH
jgi:hypothetical protein